MSLLLLQRLSVAKAITMANQVIRGFGRKAQVVCRSGIGCDTFTR
jgi:hypothetical protein